MNIVYLLSGFIILVLLAAGILFAKLLAEKRRMKHLVVILDDIGKGNFSRRALADSGDLTAELCYKINQIVMNCEARLVHAAKLEKAGNQLMTSLSHDVKTPLTSLAGYLDAVCNGYVNGAKKERYLKIAHGKAYELTEYVDVLFEWFRLSAGEQIYSFEKTDINEFTRNIIIDWIPQFEKHGFDYTICIDDHELTAELDRKAYGRIVNNLLQNAVQHSGGNHIEIVISDKNHHLLLQIIDNGKGIRADQIPHLFDRLYRCDEARSAKGSGLGLAIVKELIREHKGLITVASDPGVETVFSVTIPVSIA